MLVNLDSRTIKKGEYFVAVKGENFDGHNFIEDALKRGAKGYIEEKELYNLAKNKLKKINPQIIVVAGSVGKTTMRDYLYSALLCKYKVCKGSLNTKLGLAVNIINDMGPGCEVFVAEVGIDRIGEMEETIKFLKPHFSIITKIEKEHLQFLKNIKTVAKENYKSISLSQSSKGYVNAKDKKLVKPLVKREKIKYFSSADLNFSVNNSKLFFSNHELDYLAGIYCILSDEFGYNKKDFISCITAIKRPKGRLNIIMGKNQSILIDDSYNAVCDTSVIQGIEYAKKYAKKYKKRVSVILSPLRETGKTEKQQHLQITNYLNTNSFYKLYLVEDEKGYYKDNLKPPFKVVKSPLDIDTNFTKNDVIYIKGAQFYRTEKYTKSLMENKNEATKVLVRQDERWL